MRVYVYAEHCAMAGRVADVRDDGDEPEDLSDDLREHAAGTREEIIAECLASLATRYDTRAGGAGDDYRWRCDRAVLDRLDGPAVAYDAQARAYAVAADDDDSDDE